MKTNRAPWALAVLGLTCVLIPQTLLAQAPTPPRTLWNFLGIPQGIHKVRDATFNRAGRTPGLERVPAPKRIADPANLESDVPVIQKAAEIKEQEDLKAQKIKAIKYLAKEIGCLCYPGVKEALLAALEDCTEDVRLEAVKAFEKLANGDTGLFGHKKGGGCSRCGKSRSGPGGVDECNYKSCCDQDVVEKLAEMAYEMDEECGCWKEPSEKVREAAAEALRACCPGNGPVGEEVIETPDPENIETVPNQDPPPTPPPAETQASKQKSSKSVRFRHTGSGWVAVQASQRSKSVAAQAKANTSRQPIHQVKRSARPTTSPAASRPQARVQSASPRPSHRSAAPRPSARSQRTNPVANFGRMLGFTRTESSRQSAGRAPTRANTKSAKPTVASTHSDAARRPNQSGQPAAKAPEIRAVSASVEKSSDGRVQADQANRLESNAVKGPEGDDWYQVRPSVTPNWGAGKPGNGLSKTLREASKTKQLKDSAPLQNSERAPQRLQNAKPSQTAKPIATAARRVESGFVLPEGATGATSTKKPQLQSSKPTVKNTPTRRRNTSAQSASRPSRQRREGRVTWFNASAHTAGVQFDAGQRPEVGSQVEAYHKYLLGTEFQGRLRVVAHTAEGVVVQSDVPIRLRPSDVIKVTAGPVASR